MPFQSEKQRRYLWANEPEIARDWSDTYGHRAQGYDGGVMRVPFYAGEIVPNISTQSLGNQLAFRPNTLLDNRIKTMQNMQNMGYEQPNLPQLKQRDWDQQQKENTPLSLPKQEYSGVKGYTSLEDQPYNFSDIEGQTAMGHNIMRDFNYDVNPNNQAAIDYTARKSGPDILRDWKAQNIGNEIGLDKTAQAYLADNPQLLKGIKENLGRGIDKTKQGLGELWQGGTDIAQDVWKKGKEYGIQGKDLLMGGLGALTGVPLGLMNLMRKGIRPDTEYETYQKQMMGVDPTGSRAGKDPWGQNIRSLKGGYDVQDQWDKFAASTLGQKYNLAEIGKGGITEEEEEELRRQGLKGYQLNRALGLSKYGGKAAAWKKKRRITGQKQEKDRYKRVQEAEAAQKQRAAQAAMAAQQAASVEQAYQHQTGAGSGYSGGERTDPHGITSYHDPFDPGGGE